MDYTTFFYVLPLDVQRLIPLYGDKGVRPQFMFQKTFDVPHNFELRPTKRGLVVCKPATNMMQRMFKPNGTIVASEYGMWECRDGKKWINVLWPFAYRIDAFCVTPDNGCLVYYDMWPSTKKLIKYDDAWNVQCSVNPCCDNVWGIVKLACQSNGNVVALCCPKSVTLYSPDLHVIQTILLAYSASNFAIDCSNQIVIKTLTTLYLYSSDLTQLHSAYNYGNCSKDIRIDNRGCIYLLQKQSNSNKITILAYFFI